jgi:Flp pilus assembly protein TadD
LGDAYLNSNQSQLALSTFQAASALDPKNAPACYGIGLAYIALKNTAMARAQYDKLVPLDKATADKLLAKITPQQ